ncbi:MAG: hypothetical protein PHV20_01320 [Bacteroidales bacterium]|nr:hypothetical protein [Bacteroidales bacterium]
MKKKYGQETPFSVPENYFEQFSEKIMPQLPDKEVSKTPVVSLWKRVKPVIYLAAMFTAAIWAINLYVDKRPDDTAKNIVSVPVLASEQDAESVSLAMTVDDYSLYEYMSDEPVN